MDNKKQYIRKGQEVTFSAKLKKGDGSLTSWIVYEGNQCDDDHIVKEEKQVGTEFTFTFEKVGEYTIISYGKREEIKKKSKCINKTSISPKTNNEGKEEIVVDKLDSGCAIRLKVIENTIVSIDCVENKIRNAVRKGTTDKWELKKGASVTFKANFYIERPTEEELSSLKMFVLDSNKNILVAQEENNISFTPENNNEEYTIVAEHITPSGDKITKKITGKCVLNSVISIKPDKPGELFRPNEEIIFKVDRMKFSADLEDTSRTKWYLNTILKQEGGETFKFSSDKKGVYFVEAANIKPNSSDNKNDPDTCVFKIVDNEVKSISIKGMPKVGRHFELKAKTTFPDLTLEEMQKIKWYIPFNYKENLGGLNINPRNKTPHFHNTQRIKDPRTIKITPSGAGTFKVSCRINSEFVEKNIEIVQPKISSPHWIDKDGSSGNILKKAGYYQEMYAYVEHIGLDEEEVILEVYDVTNKQKPIYTSEKVVVPKGSKKICIPYTIKKTYKGKTEEEKKKEDRERKDIQIFFKIKAADTNFLIVSSNKEFENNLLTITNRGDIVDAYFCDAKDLNKVLIAIYGYKLYFKIYATNLLKREVEVHFCTKKAIKDDFSNSFVWRNWKELEEKFKEEYFFDVKKGVINERGELLVEVDTTKLEKFVPIGAIAIIKIINKDGNELGAYKDLNNTLKLYNKSILERLPQNFSSVKVGYFEIKEVKRVQLEEGCKGRYCITKENYKEKKAEKLVEELNIRLAGFGGNVPSEEFTDRTEMMIRQFERDYMKVPETGKICGNLLRAVDEFCEKYPINFEEVKCKCGKCDGFGNEKFSEQKGNDKIKEKNRKYEYPGIHRSLLFALKAVIFYMEKENQLGYSLNCIYSGYRCWVDNNNHNRKTTNHMGKALDLHFNKNGKRTEKVTDMEKIREDIFNKYLGAKWDWGEKNIFNLESTKTGAISWVHYDVREFNLSNLKDIFFIKNISQLSPKSMINLAQELGLSNTCSCKDSSSNSTLSNEKNRMNPKTLKISKKGIEFIKSWEGLRLEAYDDSQGFATIGYGHLIERKSIKDISLSNEYKNGISQEKADELFEKDLEKFEDAVKRDVTVPLYQNEYDALVSLLYNCGENFLKDDKAPKLYNYLKNRNYSQAADEFADIVKGGAGLKQRRQDEINIFKNNIYNNHK